MMARSSPNAPGTLLVPRKIRPSGELITRETPSIIGHYVQVAKTTNQKFIKVHEVIDPLDTRLDKEVLLDWRLIQTAE